MKNRPGICPAGLCNGGFGCQHSGTASTPKKKLMKSPSPQATQEWKSEFKNRWFPIHTNYGNPPEDITEPILEFIDTQIHLAQQRALERCIEKLMNERDEFQTFVESEADLVPDSDQYRVWGLNDAISTLNQLKSKLAKGEEGK